MRCVPRALSDQFGVVDVDTQGEEETGVSPVNELMRAVLTRGNVRVSQRWVHNGQHLYKVGEFCVPCGHSAMDLAQTLTKESQGIKTRIKDRQSDGRRLNKSRTRLDCNLVLLVVLVRHPPFRQPRLSLAVLKQQETYHLL